MGLFDIIDAVGNIAADAVRVVAAPVEVAVNVAQQVTKPVADAVVEFCDEVNEAIKD